MSQIGFLADDLTGAADVLAQAHAYGLEAMLVLDPHHAVPDRADVVGVAGPIRSMAGAELDGFVRTGLRALSGLPLSVLIYKICSTFDSSPTAGNIGRAIELLHEQFPRHGSIPVVPAQPAFGRYTAFSQHIGVYNGEAYRLDRHPVMSSHPSTPMTEADLRLVLAAQFTAPVTPIGIHLPRFVDGTFTDAWERARRSNDPAFVVDAVDEDQMDRVAAALRTEQEAPALVVGSGGIMSALARGFDVRPAAEPDRTAATGPTLVVSASASATSDAQIEDAVAAGWSEVPIPPDALGTADRAVAPVGDWVDAVQEALRVGRHVVAHTTRGGSDPRLTGSATRTAAEVGNTIGRLAGAMARSGLTHNIAICGGDTSSHALLALGVTELRVSEQFVTAGPVCVVDAQSDAAGCRLLLKGGQVGPPDIFRRFAGCVD